MVAIAAPCTPKPRTKINKGSSRRFATAPMATESMPMVEYPCALIKGFIPIADTIFAFCNHRYRHRQHGRQKQKHIVVAPKQLLFPHRAPPYFSKVRPGQSRRRQSSQPSIPQNRQNATPAVPGPGRLHERSPLHCTPDR